MAKSRSVPPSAAQKRLAAERAAAARERIVAEQRRRRLWVIASSVGVVVLVVAVFVVVKVVMGNDGLKSGKKTSAAQSSLTETLQSIPPSVFNTVGVGTTDGAPSVIQQSSLGTAAKPEVLYVGAEFCPYCAAERWPLAVALARFGSFSNLGVTSSSPTDVNPNTPTLSFHGASYTSKYLSFVGKEIETNQVVNGRYTSLDTLTPSENTLFTKAGSSFPFLDLNGAYELKSAQYDGKILAGLTQTAVARQISEPSSAISKAVIGSANVLTARLCQLTNGQPGAVCSSSGVQTAAAAIKASTATSSGGSSSNSSSSSGG